MNRRQTLPQVVDMEKDLLAALMIKDGEEIPKVMAIIQVEDFYREEHRIIYRAILKLYNQKISPNILSLVEELRSTNELDKVGVPLVMELGNLGFTTAYVETYAKKIREKATLRRLIDAGEEITFDAYNDNKPLTDILENAEKKIFNITANDGRSEFENIMPIVMRSFDRIQHIMNNPNAYTGVESGFRDLDKITSGFQKSDLILIAARPSMGKTAFALNVAVNAAIAKNTVAIFSLEMSKEQLGHRILSSQSGIDSQRLNTGDLADDDLHEVLDAMEVITELKMFIDDTAGISVAELRSKARRLKNEHGLNLIVIDYLQLMQGGATKISDSNRQQEISEISRSLKSLARELNVPVIALSQLSRNVEMRADKKPQLSDLRESGSLEQDADMVIFLYREDYYKQDTEKNNTADILIAKNRNGPTTNVKLHFRKECMRFELLDYSEM